MTMTPRKLLKLDSMPTEEVARHLEESLRWIKDNRADVRDACMPYLEQSCPHLHSVARAVGEVADDLDDYAHFIFQIGYLKGIQMNACFISLEEKAEERGKRGQAAVKAYRLEVAMAKALRAEGHKVTWAEELKAKGEGECQA